MSQSGNDAHLGENTLLYNGAGRVFLARVGRTPEEPAIVRFDLIMPIDNVTVGAVSRTIRMLTQLYRGFNIHLRIAYEDVVDELKSAHDGLAGRRRPDDTGLMRLVNRALNFSVAVRLYEEHVMSEVHRRWGKGSTQTDAVRQLFAQTFDRSFGYRVLYALRNPLVHSSEQIIGCTWLAQLDDPQDNTSTETNVQVALHVEREAFARSDARAATRHEVAQLLKNPDFLALADDALVHIEELNQALEPFLYPDIDDAVADLWHLTREHFPTASQTPHFVTVEDGPELTGDLQIQPILWDYVVRRGAAALLRRGAKVGS
ncbi:hypothetical protein AB6V29_09250 [Microbacterium sp. 20-116]|uniref:hypothetical protein n=1 Tax=Microbacterium sp. 20-116 TaxID=3239883 RepID=UPI0034E29F9D